MNPLAGEETRILDTDSESHEAHVDQVSGGALDPVAFESDEYWADHWCDYEPVVDWPDWPEHLRDFKPPTWGDNSPSVEAERRARRRQVERCITSSTRLYEVGVARPCSTLAYPRSIRDSTSTAIPSTPCRK
jgi:hypothetical protein